MQAADLTAKLLANENLTIVRSNAPTAYFDTATRVLSIPNWKDMTPELEAMFMAHEVGHALYTTHEKWIGYIDSVDKEKRGVVKGYFNCIEDARIERLIKDRYPGLRKTFFGAYKQLMERDFFSLKKKDVNSMIFIDRVNLHFKVGYSLGIKFNEEEMEFIRRIEKAQTVDEAFSLAMECYEFAKKQRENRLAEIEADDFGVEELDDQDEYDSYDGYSDEESDESEESDDESDEESEYFDRKDNGKGEDDADIESHTDKALEQNLQDLADTSIKYVYYEMETKMFRDPIVNFKRILDETKICDQKIDTSLDFETLEKDYKMFMKDSERVVNYLVKEFEMRKSASAYKRSKTSKSGSLNLNKLHAYSLTDDIFKRITVMPNGKNHGMLFLLDWSGSMIDNLSSTVKQLVNLVMFCRRINIPFEVYAFTSEYERRDEFSESYIETIKSANSWIREMYLADDKNRVFSNCKFTLLNFFSSKMSNREFNIMARRVVTLYIMRANGYSLSSTPLNDALLHMLTYVPFYKKANNIEKLTLVTLSDGAGDTLLVAPMMKHVYWENDKKIRCKNFITDPETKKTYDFVDKSYSYTSTLLDMISSRYGVDTVGFFLSAAKHWAISDAYADNVGERPSQLQIEEIKTTMRKSGFYSLPNQSYKELFLINDVATKIESAENMKIDSNSSASAIARAMTKTLVKQRHSRIVLDRFIGHVS